MSILLERIGRLIPERQPRPENIDDFIHLLEDRGDIVSVSAHPRTHVRGGARSSAVGVIGNFEYLTDYVAKTKQGKKLKFTERYGDEAQRFGSESGIADSEERSRIALKHLVTADSALKRVNEAIPNIDTAIVTHKGTPMPKEVYDELQQEKEKHNISPFS